MYIAKKLQRLVMADLAKIAGELKNGECVLYLGMGCYKGLKFSDGSEVPFDSDSVILALNEGRPMAARLMYEYTRAAMSIEQSRGRKYLEEKLKNIYKKEFEKSSVYALMQKLMPKYIVDTNYDAQILSIYSAAPHYLVQGKARIGASLDRFEIFEWDMTIKAYKQIQKEAFCLDKPVIFKPMGCVTPTGSFIVSDADFVDWITEAMGGFAVPPALKEYREGKKYLMMGLTLSKDTERMVANEITIGLSGGYFVSDQEPTKNRKRYLESHNMEAINEGAREFAKRILEFL